MLQEENGYILNVGSRALDRKEPVDIRCAFTVLADYVPEKLFLACETPEIFDITVNGKPAKASYQVKIGDVIEIAFGQRTMKVEVLNIAEHTLKADASALYKELPL